MDVQYQIKKDVINQGCMSLSTYYLEHGRHLGRGNSLVAVVSVRAHAHGQYR